MSVREAMDRNPRVVMIVVGIAVVLAIGMIIWQLMPEDTSSPTGTPYSVDDGKTYFIDAADRLPPFDYNGKPAVRAFLMKKGENGEPFVGYLMRYSEAGLAKINAAKAEAEGAAKAPPGGVVVIPPVPIGDPRLQEVKKPGSDKWVPRASAEGTAVTALKAPDGSDALSVDP